MSNEDKELAMKKERTEQRRLKDEARRKKTLALSSPAAAVSTSSSAIAERPRDYLSQLKSCQLLHNCTKNHI